MDFKECYEYVADFLYYQDFSSIGNDFTALMYITGESDGYIFFSYEDGIISVEPVLNDRVNIYVTMSSDVLEKIIKGETDILRAFTTKQIQAKGNTVLAMSIYNQLKDSLKTYRDVMMRQSYSDV